MMGYMAPSIIFINVNGRSDLTAFVISIPQPPFYLLIILWFKLFDLSLCINQIHMRQYKHNTGTIIGGYNSHKEHSFYEETTKRQMLLIIEQMAELLKDGNEDWVDRAKRELNILKSNGIK
jgi:hypothetical protein